MLEGALMLSFAGESGRTPTFGPGPWSGEPPAELTGLRVLLVEDEAMVAMVIEDMLFDLGCEVIGPAPQVAAALQLLESESIDLAVLDINLGGELVFPVADRLAALGVPFVFSTGYGVAGLDERHFERPVLQKPYEAGKLAATLSAVLGRG
jgi:CheY-like chemotaxis protein